MNPFRTIAEILQGRKSGLYKSIARDLVDGLVVNTVLTPDCGYETAVLDANNAHPVERYPDKSSALRGHKKWVEQAPALTEIERLDYPPYVKAETVILKRGYDEPGN